MKARAVPFWATMFHAVGLNAMLASERSRVFCEKSMIDILAVYERIYTMIRTKRRLVSVHVGRCTWTRRGIACKVRLSLRHGTAKAVIRSIIFSLWSNEYPRSLCLSYLILDNWLEMDFGLKGAHVLVTGAILCD
jgi:hypothetical protein